MIAQWFSRILGRNDCQNTGVRRERKRPRMTRRLASERLEDRRLLTAGVESLPITSEVASFQTSSPAAQEPISRPCDQFSNCDLSPKQAYPVDEHGNRLGLPDSHGFISGPVVGEPLRIHVQWGAGTRNRDVSYNISVSVNGDSRSITRTHGSDWGSGDVPHTFSGWNVQPGQNTVEITVDASGSVVESNEDNNAMTFSFEGRRSEWFIESVSQVDASPVWASRSREVIWSTDQPDKRDFLVDGVNIGSGMHFVIEPNIRMWAVREKLPKMKYTWNITGHGTFLSETGELKVSDRAYSGPGSYIKPIMPVELPDKIGEYQFTLVLTMIDEANQEQIWSSETHPLFVLYGRSNVRLNEEQLRLLTGLADQAPTHRSFLTMRALNEGLYEHARKKEWIYGQANRDKVDIYPNDNKRYTYNCDDMAILLDTLSKLLGIPGTGTLRAGWSSDWNNWIGPLDKFVLTDVIHTAFDGQTGNARSERGAEPDRWFFLNHRYVELTDERGDKSYFDPTFGTFSTQDRWFIGEWAAYWVHYDLGSMTRRPFFETESGLQFDKVLGVFDSPDYPNGLWNYTIGAQPLLPQITPSVTIAQLSDVGPAESRGRGKFDAYSITAQIEGPPGDYSLDPVLIGDDKVVSYADDFRAQVPLSIPVTIPESGKASITIRFAGYDLASAGSIENLEVSLSVYNSDTGFVGGQSFDLPQVSQSQFVTLPQPEFTDVRTRSVKARDGDFIETLEIDLRTDHDDHSALQFSGQLTTQDGQHVAWAYATVQSAKLQVSGREIRRAGLDGPYRLRVHAWHPDDHSSFSEEVLLTDFGLADFGTDVVTFAPASDFETEDHDGNGLADKLRFRTTVTTNRAGAYQAIASLHDASGQVVHTTMRPVELVSGAQELAFEFPGSAIGRHGKSGHFTVGPVSLLSVSGERIEAVSPFDWRTDFLSVTSFEDAPQRPFLNPLDANDVNGDGTVSPLDVLLIINELNEKGAYELSETGELAEGPTLDVNGDGSVSPLDALMIINHLNRHAIRAEGEARQPMELALTATQHRTDSASYAYLEHRQDVKQHTRRRSADSGTILDQLADSSEAEDLLELIAMDIAQSDKLKLLG